MALWCTLGSSADPIVGHFAISYHNEAAALGIDLDELFAAQLQDGEVTPPEWNIEGRQIGVYKCVLLLFHLLISSSFLRLCAMSTSLVVESNLSCGAIDNTATCPSQRSTRPAQAVRRAKVVVRSSMHSKISRSDRSRSCSTRPISRPNTLTALSYVLPYLLPCPSTLSCSSTCSLCYGVTCYGVTCYV